MKQTASKGGGGQIGQAIASLALVLALCGCVTETISTTPRNRVGGGADTAGGRGSSGGDEPIFSPEGSGTVRATNVRAGVLALGSVPYDNLTLPLVSPDGTLVATETGVAPEWSAVLAEQERAFPSETRIEVYRFTPGEPVPELLIAHPDPLLLGRSVNSSGFLVEAPQLDGARAIGLMSWADGEVSWLVLDEHVNAFASLGSDGRLAWSRRQAGSERFELVVGDRDDQWTLPADDGEWLMPHWSGHDDGLFVMRLERDRLVLCYGVATSASAFMQSRQELIIIDGASVFTAYQMLAGHVTMPDAPVSAQQQISFYHPRSQRAALWRPLAESDARLTALADRSAFALPLPGTSFALVSAPKDLVRQEVGARAGASLLSGIWIPRASPEGDWPYTLLGPREGRITVTAMVLLAVE